MPQEKIPDTYIDPFTGEEKKVDEWNDPDAPPLNSPRWVSYGEDGLDLPDDPDEQSANRNSAWMRRQRRLQLIWWYAAAVLLFVLLNLWVFREGIHQLLFGK